MKCPQCGKSELAIGTVECPECRYSFPRAETVVMSLNEDIERTIRGQLAREFKVERLLGRGGMSLVYLARETELNRPTAVKILPLQLSFDDSAVDRFKREAKIAASLDHPHIVPVFRVGATPAFLWYSMKYVKGQSLGDLLEKTGKLDLEMTIDILEQMASALSYAHRRGVIHRDIKPSNAMIDQEGWVTVCDFGVAKAFGTLPLTQTGSTIGTPGYMSPEQCYGNPLDGRSDLYSLGILTYECLTGKPPFRGDSLAEYVRLHCTVPPLSLTEVLPDIPDHVAQAVTKALAKSPDGRFSDVVEFIQAIGGRVGRRPPPVIAAAPSETVPGPATPATPPPITAERQPRPAWRKRARRWGGYAAVGVLLVALVLTLPGPDAPPSGLASTSTGEQAEGSPPMEAGAADAGEAAPSTEPAPPTRVANAGTLFISSRPLGDLFIDGRRVGESFTPNGLPIAPGTRTIRVEREGYEPYEQKIDVAPGQAIRLTRIVLRRLPS